MVMAMNLINCIRQRLILIRRVSPITFHFSHLFYMEEYYSRREVLTCLFYTSRSCFHFSVIIIISQIFRSLMHHSLQQLGCTTDKKNVIVIWSDGEESKYHSMWLLHNCQCPECWDSSSTVRRAAVDKLQGNPVIVNDPVLSGKPVVIYGSFLQGSFACLYNNAV